ncbi:hypothetical protein Tco_1020506 [Tanacetum coccineum]
MKGIITSVPNFHSNQGQGDNIEKGKFEVILIQKKSCNGKIVGAQHFAASAIVAGLFNPYVDFASPLDGAGHGRNVQKIITLLQLCETMGFLCKYNDMNLAKQALGAFVLESVLDQLVLQHDMGLDFEVCAHWKGATQIDEYLMMRMTTLTSRGQSCA